MKLFGKYLGNFKTAKAHDEAKTSYKTTIYKTTTKPITPFTHNYFTIYLFSLEFGTMKWDSDENLTHESYQTLGPF